ncbi:MAG: hypothetical protein PVI21_05690 [Candidatus Woesebacteria bacterium]|jgi:hypothetical protein
MAKLLSDLLDAKEPLFSENLRQLESLSGQCGYDIGLVGDILAAAHEGTRQLDLDHKDTTGPELYHALLSRYQQDDSHFLKTIGCKREASVNDIFEHVKSVIEKADVLEDCWVLKKSAARRILREMPPTAVMSHLGYRSVDSMLKHERLPEVYGALRFVENTGWLKQFNKLYAGLKPADFERRDAEIIIMPIERWGKFASKIASKKCHNVTQIKELGYVYILPTKDGQTLGLSVRLTALVLYYLNEIRLYGSYSKLSQVRKDFGRALVNALIDGGNCGVSLGGQQVHWRVIKRHFANADACHYPKSFEPHLQLEDLHWRNPEDAIADIDPTLKFWCNRDYVGLPYGDGALSFNLLDIAEDYCMKLPYTQRGSRYLKESLQNEIFVRYLGHSVIEAQILQKIDDHMLEK